LNSTRFATTTIANNHLFAGLSMLRKGELVQSAARSLNL